jgi:mRNA interferase MazF
MFERGDIVAINFPFSDGSGSKLRPALVLSNNTISATNDVIVLMISSRKRDIDITIELTPELTAHVLPKNSFVKCHRVFTINRTLIKSTYSTLSEKGLAAVLKKLIAIIS